MRKYQTALATVMVLLMITVACTSEEQEPGTGNDGVVAFTVKSSNPTRASDTQFDTGDAIGVFASMEENGRLASRGNYADNVKYVYSSNRFINAGAGIPLATDIGHEVSYYAVYPFMSSASSSFTFTVNEDQSTYDKYTKSDLCMATTTTSPSEAIVPLKFDHMLSRVMIDASLAGLVAGNYRIELLAYDNSVTVNMQEQSVTTQTGTTATHIKMCEDGTNHFKAILPPQYLRVSNVVAILYIGLNPAISVMVKQDIELVSGTSVELRLLRNSSGNYYLDYGGTGDSSIPKDPEVDDTPDVVNPNINIPNVQYICEISGNDVICRLDMTGIQHPETLEWLRLYGTNNPEQNIWISLDGKPKGFSIYNNADENGGNDIKTDIVFIVDNSGSMSEEANAVARDIISWSQQLVSSGLNVRFACVGYSVSGTINGATDFTDASGLSTYLNRSVGTSRTVGFYGSNASALSSAASSYRVSDECGAMAIRYADANLTFRSGANRIYVNFTDEPNQPAGKQGFSVEFFKSQSNWGTTQGTVHTVYSDTYTTFAESLYYKEFPWKISDYTGGTKFFTNSSFSGVNLSSLPVTGAMQHSYVIRFKNIAYMVGDGQQHLLTIVVYSRDGKVRGTRTYYVTFVLGS